MDEQTAATIATVERFNDALNRHDVDAVMALMTDDCIFENTFPAPDGERFAGQAAVRGFWEEMFAHGDRLTARWRYEYANADGTTGHIRGADVFRVRDGKVAEKLAYVKG
jgi:ketosteroid isomerase-like protein